MAQQKSKSAKTEIKSNSKTNYSRLYPVILIAVIFILYGRTLHNQYLKMDDTDLIVDNEVFIKHLKNIPQAFRQSCFEIPGHLTDNKSYYRPLLIVSFMMDAQVHGARGSVTFHFMNILYHLLACLLLYYLILKLGANALTALALSFLFAVHPVNVHAVAWIPGRNDILLTIFALLSMHGLIDYNKNNKTSSLALHLMAYTAALFTKESGVILLSIYFLFMWLWMKDLAFYKRKIFIPVSYLVITAIWYLAMTAALKGHENIGGGESIVKVIIHNLPYLFLYIGKILLPFNLNIMPGADTMAIILGLASMAGLAYLIYRINDIRKILFCLFWFFIFLAPTLLVPELPAFEHRDYLPLIGLLIGISQAGFFKNFSFKNRNLLYSLGVIALVFIIVVFTRLPVYADRFTFWNDGTEGTPFAPSACVNVGQLYQDMYDNDPDLNPAQKKEALKNAGEWNHKAILLDSTTLRGNNNYGAYLYLSGNPDAALPYFMKEIKFHPTNDDPYKNVGIYYKDKGQPDKSVYYWEKLIQMNRYYLTAYEELANYYARKGDMAKAAVYRDEEKTLTDEAQKNYNKIK